MPDQPSADRSRPHAGERAEYAPPMVQDLDASDAPSVTAAAVPTTVPAAPRTL